MNELTLFGEAAKMVESFGVIGVIILFVAFQVWLERREAEKDKIDREVLTNHLSAMIREDNKSRQELAVGLTKLAESVNNFQSRCGQIQNNLQNEVDRMMKG